MVRLVEVQVTMLSGVSCQVSARDDWTLKDIKTEIADRMRVPYSRQRLISDCSNLTDDSVVIAGLLSDHSCAKNVKEVTSDAPMDVLKLSLLVRPEREAAFLDLMRAGHPEEFAVADPELQSSKEIAMAAVAQKGILLRYASAELRDDPDVVLKAVATNGQAFRYASSRLKTDRSVVIAAVAAKGQLLQNLSEELRSDEAVVKAAVTQDGMSLQYASESLRAKAEVVLAAVGQTGFALQHASLDLLADKDFMMRAIRLDGQALRFAAAHLRAEARVIRLAVKSERSALQHASAELKADRDFILSLVKKDGLLLEFVEEFKTDPQIALAAVRQNSQAVRHTIEQLASSQDVDFVREMMKMDGFALTSVSPEMSACREVVLAAVRKNGLALEYAAAELRADREVVSAAVLQDQKAVRFAAKHLKNDKDILRMALGSRARTTQIDLSLSRDLKLLLMLLPALMISLLTFFGPSPARLVQTVTGYLF
eukprot:TRINITY_DN33437_c0_g1_i1.p1 TRINITY_DN33437_c0_g1~~TRINITY_DN33437_c0_g1_i1.p1  ORF type:complete len:496 (+),score=108.39 TRINITY_DN33437_c0_g1_i1:40-1488(+)